MIKVSLNNKLNFAIMTKIPLYGLEDIATLSAGIGVSGLASKDLSYKTGFELNINLWFGINISIVNKVKFSCNLI